MQLSDYVELIQDAINRNEVVVFGCHCDIRYSGRAESKLSHGDRLFVVKRDKALLIHQPHGNTPINYMKAESSHAIVFDEGTIRFTTTNGKESLTATISKVYFFNSAPLQDAEVISVVGTEEDMSDMLYEHPEMIEDGFKPASREEQTAYGFIDVFGTDKDGIVTVVECKRYCADLAAVTQLRRYVEKVMVSKGITRVRGILAAPKITENAKQMLEDWGFSFVSVKPPKYLEEEGRRQSRLDHY